MYDRKTWVVLAICGALIAVNLHYAGKNRPGPPKKSVTAENIISDTDAPTGLTEQTPPPPTTAEFIVLENAEVKFTLTNIGAGIKHAELKNHQNVANKKTNVLINEHGGGPIGGLVDSNQNLDTTTFSFKEDQSTLGKVEKNERTLSLEHFENLCEILQTDKNTLLNYHYSSKIVDELKRNAGLDI